MCAYGLRFCPFKSMIKHYCLKSQFLASVHGCSLSDGTTSYMHATHYRLLVVPMWYDISCHFACEYNEPACNGLSVQRAHASCLFATVVL